LPPHPVRQLDPPQTYAPQLTVPGWVHVPEPLQCDAGWYVDAVHDAPAPHGALLAASWQPPLPLHAPVLPHGGLAAHWPAGAPVPAGMSAHVPGLLVRLHALHVPQLPALQQTPSVQKSLLHWFAAPHAAPSAFFATHVPGALLLIAQ
jgi:hypothetical protein